MKQSIVWRFGSGALVALFAALPVTGALAQQAEQRTVARLKHLNGNVLVSMESGLTTGNEAQPLVNGMRVITTANSDVIVVFDDGCEVHVRQNERFEVDSLRPCALLQVQSFGTPPPVAAEPIQGLYFPVGSAVLLIDGHRRQSVSPN